MSTWPSNLAVLNFSAQLKVAQLAAAGIYNGGEQVADLLNDRWYFSITTPTRERSAGAGFEAFLAGLRGMTGTVDLWHMERGVPNGTMRGTPTCQAASQGASAVVLNATPGDTLLAGDMLGVGGLLLMVQENATANISTGVMNVSIVNRLRKAIANNAAVTWNQPTIPCRMTNVPTVRFAPGMVDSISLEFVEVVS